MIKKKGYPQTYNQALGIDKNTGLELFPSIYSKPLIFFIFLFFYKKIDAYYDLRAYENCYKILILPLCFINNNSCLDLNSFNLDLSYND